MKNFVYQMGNLTREVEVGHTKSGSAYVNCGIATNRSVPDGKGGFEQEATFVDFTMWGPRAESFARFHQRGSMAFINGRLSTDSWVDKASGQPRSKLKMIAEDWEFCTQKDRLPGDSKSMGDAQAPQGSEDTPF